MNRPSPESRHGTRSEPARQVRRRRALATGALVVVGAAVASIVLLATGGRSTHPAGTAGSARPADSAASGRSEGSRRPPPAPGRGAYAVGLRILHLKDASRPIVLPDGTSEPRPLVTEVFYPALAPAGSSSAPAKQDAPPARTDGPSPLVIFGHGFAVTPKLYAPLLRAWTRAGYVVAAPVFPLESAEAPGGPNESDLVNQPADMRFVISQILALNQMSSGPLAGLVDPGEIAVSGQSDGGDTALAVAYEARNRDRRVDAAIILSGAEIPARGPFTFPQDGPPLLATQGTADTVNLPSETEAFFQAAHRPKYLLRLIGAPHLPPYSTEQPELTIVERVTIAFLDRYLEHVGGALHTMRVSGSVPGKATLLAEP